MAKKEPIKWITVNGVHVPIFEGEDTEIAVKNHFAKQVNKDADEKKKQIQSHQKEADRLNGKERTKEDMLDADSFARDPEYKKANEAREKAWNKYMKTSSSEDEAEFKKHLAVVNKFERENLKIQQEEYYGTPKKTEKTEFTGFQNKTTMGYVDDALKSGDAYVAEMSPQEYLGRVAKIFGTTYERQIGTVQESTARDYAKRLKAGEKAPMLYLNYRDNQQEGRHRAMAAFFAGIDTIPVAVFPKRRR